MCAFSTRPHESLERLASFQHRPPFAWDSAQALSKRLIKMDYDPANDSPMAIAWPVEARACLGSDSRRET